MDVSKAIDKAAGAEREITHYERHGATALGVMNDDSWEAKPLVPYTAPATPEAIQWQGWGTALKPAWEPIILARKPFKGTVANNVLTYGTGALNIDGCRVPIMGNNPNARKDKSGGCKFFLGGDKRGKTAWTGIAGRFPANLIHDGLDGQDWTRYFYCAKASKKDRGEGNTHPTVKPNSLMRYLCRLITPPGGMVLDPFAGSGSTLLAARQEGFSFVGIEQEQKYVDIIKERLA